MVVWLNITITLPIFPESNIIIILISTRYFQNPSESMKEIILELSFINIKQLASLLQLYLPSNPIQLLMLVALSIFDFALAWITLIRYNLSWIWDLLFFLISPDNEYVILNKFIISEWSKCLIPMIDTSYSSFNGLLFYIFLVSLSFNLRVTRQGIKGIFLIRWSFRLPC